MEYKSKEDIWSQESVQEQIKIILKSIGQLLIEKNRKYGNSAIQPVRIFSRSDSEEQIKVRLDDKLSRIANHQDDDNEDSIMDAMGYIILLQVRKNLKKIENDYTNQNNIPENIENKTIITG